jgi:hypothetical protein
LVARSRSGNSVLSPQRYGRLEAWSGDGLAGATRLVGYHVQPRGTEPRWRWGIYSSRRRRRPGTTTSGDAAYAGQFCYRRWPSLLPMLFGVATSQGRRW